MMEPASSTTPRILVVEDEAALSLLLTYNLESEGYAVARAERGDDAEVMLAEMAPDLVILDWMLPGVSGFELCRRIRARDATRDLPVIMLTARAQTNDRIAGLESGADDYLTKPFSPRELMLRIGAVLRRSQKVVMLAEQRIGEFLLDRKNMSLSINGKLVELTITELKLITTLMANPDVIHSRSELLSAVWGYADDTHSRTLDTHIKRLRDKLGDHGRHIGTLRRQGYLFHSVVGESTDT